VLAEAKAHRAVLTQAFWLNSASAAGSIGATAAAGWAVGAYGAHGGFAVAETAAARVERMLEKGSLACPVCGGRLARWGYGLERRVFGSGRQGRAVRPR